MKMWIDLLASLDEDSNRLRDGTARAILEGSQRAPYKRIEHSAGPVKVTCRLDWSLHYAVTGSAAVYKLANPLLGLTFYDRIFLQLQPCPQEAFDQFHYFAWSDLARIVSYARRGRISFCLSDSPRRYAAYPYLQPLFEEFRPLFLAHAEAAIVEESSEIVAFQQESEKTTDLPHIQSALRRYASSHHLPPGTADATICLTLQNLFNLGYERLARECLHFLSLEPDIAIEFISYLRLAVTDPILARPGLSTALDVDSYAPFFRMVDPSFKRNNISSVADVGAVLAKYLSFPTPTDWTSLRWCEDNLDLAGIRKAFKIIDDEARDLPAGGCIGGHVQTILAQAWERKVRSISETKNRVVWGTSMSLAVAGSFVAPGTTGILSALGLAAASNIWLESASAQVARLLNPTAFHLWEIDRTGARL